MTRIVIHTLDVHGWTVNSLSYVMKDSYSSESNCSGLLIEASRLFSWPNLNFCGILLTLFWRYLVLPSLQCLLIHLRNGRVFNDWRLALIMCWDLTWTGFKSLYISGPDSNDLRLDSWTEPKSLSFAFTCRQNPQKRLQLCSALFSLLFPFHIKHHSPADLISGNMLCTDFLTGPLRNSGYCSSHHSNCSPSLPFGGPGMKLSPLSSDRNPLPPAASRHSSPAVSSSHTHAAS